MLDSRLLYPYNTVKSVSPQIDLPRRTGFVAGYLQILLPGLIRVAYTCIGLKPDSQM